MKWQVIILMMVAMVSLVSATDICQDYVKPITTCKMVSPEITCSSYNYSIINSTADYIENSTLSSFGSLYYFNFTEPTGQYIVRLCDGTTREIYVQSEDDNMSLAIILIPLVLGIMLLLASFFLGEEHTIFRIFMFALSFLCVTASLYLGSVFTYYNDPGNILVQDAIGRMMSWIGMFDFLLIAYIMIYVTIKLFKSVKQDKEDKLKY